MSRHTLEGNPPIEVILRRSARAKRLSLRVSRLDGRVTLTLPPRAHEKEGIAFLEAREEWLRGHLGQVSPVVQVDVGQEVLVEGRMLPVLRGTTQRSALGRDWVTVPATGPVGPRVKALLRARARDALAQASDTYAAEVNRSYTRISLRDTRSRWGSCSSKGVLMYSWRLIMAPPEVLQYVAAHEVAHLVEMNHSEAFWDVVARIYPRYRDCKDWLRENGDQLHRYDFGD